MRGKTSETRLGSQSLNVISLCSNSSYILQVVHLQGPVSCTSRVLYLCSCCAVGLVVLYTLKYNCWISLDELKI